MRRLNYLAFLILSSLALLTSCKGASNSSSYLSIEAAPDVAYLVPGKSNYGNCYESDVTEPRVGFTTITTTWSHPTATFTPVILRLVIDNNSFIADYTGSVVDGDFLLGTFLGSGNVTGYLDPDSISTSICPFAAGGLPINSEYKDARGFSTSAKLELVGLYTDPTDGLIKSIKAFTRVKLIYDP